MAIYVGFFLLSVGDQYQFHKPCIFRLFLVLINPSGIVYTRKDSFQVAAHRTCRQFAVQSLGSPFKHSIQPPLPGYGLQGLHSQLSFQWVAGMLANVLMGSFCTRWIHLQRTCLQANLATIDWAFQPLWYFPRTRNAWCNWRVGCPTAVGDKISSPSDFWWRLWAIPLFLVPDETHLKHCSVQSPSCAYFPLAVSA